MESKAGLFPWLRCFFLEAQGSGASTKKDVKIPTFGKTKSIRFAPGEI